MTISAQDTPIIAIILTIIARLRYACTNHSHVISIYTTGSALRASCFQSTFSVLRSIIANAAFNKQ